MSDATKAERMPEPASAPGVTIKGPMRPGYDRVLSVDALTFAAHLDRRFGAQRSKLLQARRERQACLDRGELPGFLPKRYGEDSGACRHRHRISPIGASRLPARWTGRW